MPQPNLNQMMKQVQQMQADMAEAQEKLKDETVEASAGGGMVKLKMSGDLRLLELQIDPEAIDPEDPELLQDMVLAAVNEGIRAAQELATSKLGGVTGGLGGAGGGLGVGAQLHLHGAELVARRERDARLAELDRHQLQHRGSLALAADALQPFEHLRRHALLDLRLVRAQPVGGQQGRSGEQDPAGEQHRGRVPGGEPDPDREAPHATTR